MNYLPIFDPSLWPQRELLGRLTGIMLCISFIIHRIFRFHNYTGNLPQFLRYLIRIFRGDQSWSSIHLGISDWHWFMWFSIWIIETGIFMGYILAFVSREKASSVAKGFMEVVFPIIIAALPIIITLTPMNFRVTWPHLLQFLSNSAASYGFGGIARINLVLRNWEPTFVIFLFLIICGGLINLTGLFTLRKAFTIMSEARLLIRKGIFSIVRHPLYTGHFIMFFGYLMFHLYWYTCVLYILFISGQYVRARIEENKLMRLFPEYADYMRTTGMFFPRLSGEMRKHDNQL
jgi:protein-S-isoprenylcysteine O-methyltransferase Ste14